MSGSICTRCGKPRIIVDTYEEKVETSTVIYTITECSDPECQKQVNKTLKQEAVKRKFIKDEQVKREDARRKIIEDKKAERIAEAEED
ncbi:MAG: hypothetical protein AAB778_00045 [Patescibacteria group bacterium]